MMLEDLAVRELTSHPTLGKQEKHIDSKVLKRGCVTVPRRVYLHDTQFHFKNQIHNYGFGMSPSPKNASFALLHVSRVIQIIAF